MDNPLNVGLILMIYEWHSCFHIHSPTCQLLMTMVSNNKAPSRSAFPPVHTLMQR